MNSIIQKNMNEYKIAVLCYLYNNNNELLLLHRSREPNKNFYSPVGGKLEQTDGESPHECASREILEETGLKIMTDRLICIGLVTEKSYKGTHWMIFLYKCIDKINTNQINKMEFEEGKLEWIPLSEIKNIPIPPTDRDVIWPLVQSNNDSFFMVHIDCESNEMNSIVY